MYLVCESVLYLGRGQDSHAMCMCVRAAVTQCPSCRSWVESPSHVSPPTVNGAGSDKSLPRGMRGSTTTTSFGPTGKAETTGKVYVHHMHAGMYSVCLGLLVHRCFVVYESLRPQLFWAARVSFVAYCGSLISSEPQQLQWI